MSRPGTSVTLKNGTIIFINSKKKIGMIKGIKDDLFFVQLTKEELSNLKEGDNVSFESKPSDLKGLLDIQQKAISLKKVD